VVLLSAGAKPLIPRITGINGKNVVLAEQVLRGEVILSGKVAIAGGGQIGCETAHYLLEKGCKVSIIEMLPGIALKEEMITQMTLTKILHDENAEILTNTRIDKFTKTEVYATNIQTNEKICVECDSIVLAFGTVPENSLYNKLAERFPVISIGDCNGVGNIQTAIESGFFAALRI